MTLKTWHKFGEKDDLLELSADATPGFDGDESQALARCEELRLQLIGWQERLYAESRQRLLVVLQAMDTGGKDGLIRRVFSGVNPMGVKVARFERPTPHELARDYLWRVHPHVPANGEITIFNRSHYEDVLVVRVNALVAKARWKKRYEHIRRFERMLADEGTRIVKIYLHIDRDEQARRLQARLDDPEKNWKFDEHDLVQRERWNDYMAAFKDAIIQTDRKYAPWYVIPANRKWYRDYAALNILVSTLADMDPKFPKPTYDPAQVRVV